MRTRTIEIPTDVGVYQSDSLPVANQICTNLIPWIEETEGESVRGFLTNGFGIESVVNPQNGQFKEMHFFAGKLYVLIGLSLWRIASDDTATLVGSFSGDLGGETPIIEDNGEVMAILFPGASLWFYDTTSGLVKVTDPVVVSYEAEEGGIQSLAFVKGVFIYQTKSTMFSGSTVNTNSGKDFDALDLVEPFLNDNVKRVVNIRDELYCFGENRTKLYGAAATGSFPFVEITGGAFDKGLANRYSVVPFDNAAVFIGGGSGEGASVWRLTGAASVSKISTSAIDSRINQLDIGDSEISHAAAYKLSVDGHFLVGFTIGDFLNAETYFYDATSSALKGRHMWHRRIGITGSDWVVRSVAEAYGRFYAGASSVGIGRISKGVYQEFGHNTETDFSGYYLTNMQRPVTVNYVELVLESGVGNEWLSVQTEGRFPKVELLVSIDKGRTWISLGEREMGAFQDFRARPRWNALGQADESWLFRFKCSDPVKRVFHKIVMEVEGGRH